MSSSSSDNEQSNDEDKLKKEESASSASDKEPATVEAKDKDVDRLAEELKGLEVKEKAPESLRQVASWIKESKRIMVLSGAGVSCSAGIPDFRSPGTGLYHNLQKYNLPYPEAVFDLGFYSKNPRPFLSLAKELWPGLKFSPTVTHSFISLLAKKGLLLRNYSQNIDGLEFLAKIPPELTMECHGHFRTSSCIRCHRPATNDVQHIILETNEIPRCSHCDGLVKPDIVFFGESLPERYMKLLPVDLAQADLLIVMGTSLLVAPVSMIPDLVDDGCKRVLLNRERVGELMDDGIRDVVHEGDCDEAVLLLAKLLGWHEELLELNESTRIVPKKENVESCVQKDANENTPNDSE